MVLRWAGRHPAPAGTGPQAASYLRAPGDTEFRAFKFDVLRIEGGRIAEITTFDATLFPEFGLPPTLTEGVAAGRSGQGPG